MSYLEKIQRLYRITAAPQISEFTHDLGTDKGNREMLEHLRGLRSDLLYDLGAGVELRRYDTVVALLTPSSVDYAYFFRSTTFRGLPALEEAYLWKDIESDHATKRIKGERLPVYTVLEVFLAMHPVFISDQKHSVEGFEWWDRLVKDKAFARNIFVYVENEHKALVRITKDQYPMYRKLMWGTEPKHLERRLILSKVEIP